MSSSLEPIGMFFEHMSSISFGTRSAACLHPMHRHTRSAGLASLGKEAHDL